MDPLRHSRRLMGSRGVATIIVGGVLLFFLIIFLIIGIDFARMYYVRGELQNAGDSAALAAGAKLTGDIDDNGAKFIQMDARKEAWKFACKNGTAQAKVFLRQMGGCTSSDPTDLSCCENPPETGLDEGDNGLTGSTITGDIIVGNWNSAASACPSLNNDVTNFCPANGTTGRLINAVMVWPKRVRGREGTTGGPVELLFKGIAQFFPATRDADYLQAMDVRRIAVAARLPRASIDLTACYEVCNGVATYPDSTAINPPRLMKVGTAFSIPVVPDDQQICWSNIGNTQSSTNTNELKSIMCDGTEGNDVCDSVIYTTMGNATPLINALQSNFLNPLYDPLNKGSEIVESISPSVPQPVWWVTMPVLSQCDACTQGTENDPKTVQSYARLRIIAVCRKNPHNPDPCNLNYDEMAVCTNGFSVGGSQYPTDLTDLQETVVIDRIGCLSCGDKWNIMGTRASLVK